MARSINQAGIDLIKQFEGFRDTAYKCPAGIWTIGYGHTRDVTEGMTCTQEEADQWLANDLLNAESGVERLITVPLSDNQFAALVSFAFNVGLGNLESSSLRGLLNNGNYDCVPSQLCRWDHVNGAPNAGLFRRRVAEGKLWITSDVS